MWLIPGQLGRSTDQRYGIIVPKLTATAAPAIYAAPMAGSIK